MMIETTGTTAQAPRSTMMRPKGRRSISSRVSAVTREESTPNMNELRSSLLALHKSLLAAERGQYERVHGRVANAEFLQIVSDPGRYGWLKPFTALILAIDAPEHGGDVTAEARELLKPPKADTPFGRR